MKHEPINTKTYFEEVGAWPRNSHNLVRMYVLGFVLSIVLTLISYAVAATSVFSQNALFIALGVLALVQFVVQLVCFLHLGRESAARERVIVLGFALVVVFILVAGSLWIMISLNGRMMPTPQQMEQFIHSQGGF